MAKCLYNGIELPALPTWDVATYPYCYIYTSISFGYSIWCSKTIISFDDTKGENITDTTNGSVGYSYTYDLETDTWRSRGDDWCFWDAIYDENMVWCNHDMLNTSDNSIYLAASDPILIPYKIDQRSFLIGYHLGLAGGPIPIGEPFVPGPAVYDDELPIEWSMADITTNFTLDMGGPLTKISKLTWPVEDYLEMAVPISAQGESITMTIAEDAVFDDGIRGAVILLDDTINNLVEIITIPEEYAGVDTGDGFIFESGTYILFVNETGIPTEEFSFSISISGGSSDPRTLYIVNKAAVTDDSVVYTIDIGESGTSYLKISDNVMTVEDIGASSLWYSTTSCDTIGEYIAEQNNQYIKIDTTPSGVHAFAALFPILLSVPEAGMQMGSDSPIFEESGTYILIPQDGSTIKARLVEPPKSPITWDGNTEGLESYVFLTDNDTGDPKIVLYKITDQIPSTSASAYVGLSISNEDEISDISDAFIAESTDPGFEFFIKSYSDTNNIIILTYAAAIITEDIYDDDGTIMWSKGVWFAKTYGENGFHTTALYFEKQVYDDTIPIGSF